MCLYSADISASALDLISRQTLLLLFKINVGTITVDLYRESNVLASLLCSAPAWVCFSIQGEVLTLTEL